MARCHSRPSINATGPAALSVPPLGFETGFSLARISTWVLISALQQHDRLQHATIYAWNHDIYKKNRLVLIQ
jgi:hypothetical protein